MMRGRWVAAMVCALASAPAALAQETVLLPAIRGETEPGAVFAGNWSAVYDQLQAVVARPRSEDAQIIAAVRAMGDAAPPPFLMEMGRRLADTDARGGSYWFRLGLMRTQWAALRCVDGSAQGGYEMILHALAEPGQELITRFDELALRLAAVERLGNGDAIFAGTASAWWICSHGMQAMMRSMEPGAATGIPLSEWYAGETERRAAERRIRDVLPELIARDRAALAGGGAPR